MRPRHLLSASTLLAVAASAPAPSGSFNAPVGGTWDYVATETEPIPSTITGTLKIDAPTSGNFTGSLSITLTPSGGGSPTAMSGPLTGQSVSNTAVEFDACLDACTVPWTHLGQVSGDSLTGSWIQQGGPIGTFRAHRTGP